MPKVKTPVAARLLMRVLCDLDTQCWIWQGATAKGYGVIHSEDGRILSTHRLAYALYVGAIPGALELHHTCQNKRCCNPQHLRAVTAREHRHIDPKATQNMTICKRGHALSAENVMVVKTKTSQQRMCRACHRLRFRNSRLKDLEAYRAYQREYQKARRQRLMRDQSSAP